VLTVATRRRRDKFDSPVGIVPAERWIPAFAWRGPGSTVPTPQRVERSLAISSALLPPLRLR